MKHFTTLKMLFLTVAFMLFGGNLMADKFIKIANHSDVTEDGVYLIVDVTSGRALTSANGSTAAPTAVSIPLSGDIIEGTIADDLKWQFTAADGGYTIYPIGDDTKWLYSTNANNGVRVGTNSNKVFELNVTDVTKPNYKGFKHVGTGRYLGVYISQDWRAYGTIGTNIDKTQIEIFELDTSIPVDPTISVQGVVEMLAIVNTPTNETVKVNAANLTAGITISGAVAPFAVTPTSLGSEGGDITITYSPTAAGTHTATLVLSSAGADNRTIELSGEAFATVGDGSKTNPFTVADVKLLNNSTDSGDNFWVKGYIVGVPTSGTADGLTNVTLQPPFGPTAIALADQPEETDVSTMIGVQLPAGDIRAALNLLDNPVNLNQEVSVYGVLEGYFSGAPGVTKTSDYELHLTGVTHLDAPVATDGTGIKSSTFTANWNAVTDAEEYVIDVYTKGISEAGEELVVNGGFEDEDLSVWSGTGFSNMTVKTDNPYQGDKYLSRTGEANARVEQTIDVEVGNEYTFSFWYNSYDAASRDGIKNYSVHGTGGTNYIEGGAPKKLLEATEWTKYEQVFTATEDKVGISIRVYQDADIDEVSLKANAGAEVLVPVTGSPFTVTETSYTAKGLTPETDYYYVVKAVTGVVESDWSNEVKVTTTTSVGVERLQDAANVYAYDNTIVVNTDAGSLIEVFNISGQKIISLTAASDMTNISVPNKGVLIVRVGQEVTKVVM